MNPVPQELQLTVLLLPQSATLGHARRRVRVRVLVIGPVQVRLKARIEPPARFEYLRAIIVESHVVVRVNGAEGHLVVALKGVHAVAQRVARGAVSQVAGDV